ncbi:type VI secretion system contractile sheath large subunit, partial [Rhodovulum sulfidophilum]|nr:type VI secretion system contractile sheath large subunit [Rhodovulum sulfidophilum]
MTQNAERQAGAAEGALDELSEFQDILKQTIKPRSDIAAREVDNAVTALAREALGSSELIAEDVIDTLDAMIARLDEKLSDQVNEILHEIG